MILRLQCECKIRDKSVEAFVCEYKKRLQPYFDFEFLESSCASKQFEKIRREAGAGDFFIGLDIKGKKFDSNTFSSWLDLKRSQARSLTFIIGAAEGLSNEARGVISEYISLSDMTFSYRVSLMVLSEQLYRATTIITGHPYHK